MSPIRVVDLPVSYYAVINTRSLESSERTLRHRINGWIMGTFHQYLEKHFKCALLFSGSLLTLPLTCATNHNYERQWLMCSVS